MNPSGRTNRKRLVRLLFLVVAGLIAILFARSYIRDLSNTVSNDDAEDIIKLDRAIMNEKGTVVEGEIMERSSLPDPADMEYPDCRYTVHFRGNAILSGKPCPKEISLVVDGIKNYKTTRLDELKRGDRVECLVIPFDSLPPEAQSTQTADNLNLFMLNSYYAVSIRRIRYFKEMEHMPTSEIVFSDRAGEYVSIFDRHVNPAISPEVKQAQDDAIRQDLGKMNRLLSGYDDARIREINERFDTAWEKEKAKDPPGYNRVVDQDKRLVWRNISRSFWSLPEEYAFLSKPDMLTPETLESFSSLKDAFEANGIQFIVLLVPDLYVISSRVMNPEFRDVPDLQSAMYVKQLSEIGVETIYSSDAVIRNWNRYPIAFWYPSDPHPGDVAQEVMAELAAERLKRYQLKQELNPSSFSIRTIAVDNKKIVFPDNCDIDGNQPGARFPGNKILYENMPVPRTGGSPVLIIGNSFLQTPVSSSDSFPSYVSWKTLSPVDWYVSYRFGSITDIPLRFLSDARPFFSGKKVLIMMLGTSHLRSVNQASLMLNLRKYDSDLLLLNKKQCRGRYRLPGTDEKDLSEAKEKMPSIENNNLFKIGKEGGIEHSFDIQFSSKEVDDSKPLVCVIPSLSAKGMTVSVSVNGQKKQMNSDSLSLYSKYFNLLYELPAGTRDIAVKFEGEPGSVFAVKDIQIWQ